MKTKEYSARIVELEKYFFSKNNVVKAIDNVSFDVNKGEIVGLIGESGSGKTTIGNTIVRLIENYFGNIIIDDHSVSGKLRRRGRKFLAKKVQMIFQDPYSTLNDKLNIFSILKESYVTSGQFKNDKEQFYAGLKDVKYIFKNDLNEVIDQMEYQNRLARATELVKFYQSAKKDIQELPQQINSLEQLESVFAKIVNDTYQKRIKANEKVLTTFNLNFQKSLDKYFEFQNLFLNDQVTGDEKIFLNAKKEYEKVVKAKKINAQELKVLKQKIKRRKTKIKDLVRERKEFYQNMIRLQKAQNFAIKQKLHKTDNLAKAKKLQEELQNNRTEITLLKLLRNIPTSEAEHKKLQAITINPINEELLSKQVKKSYQHIDEIYELRNQYVIKKLAFEKPNKVLIAKHKAKFEQAKQTFEKYVANSIQESNANKKWQQEQADLQVLEQKVVILSKQVNDLLVAKINVLKTRASQKEEKLSFKKFQQEVKKAENTIKAFQIEYKNQHRSAVRLKELTINNHKFIITNWRINQLILKRKITTSLQDSGLKAEHTYRYPHEFSGGQRQRIAIARALIGKPELIIADEPISSLDISIQAQIVNMLKDLVKKEKLSMIFIAHDLSMVEYLADSLQIMHLGKVVERGNTAKIFANPRHPYTQQLFDAIPKISNANRQFKQRSFNEEYLEELRGKTAKYYNIGGASHQILATDKQAKEWI